ncbi:hypothetical protein B0H17DRAFT_423809 [Mycena rosella]|uniref:Uncharacterized protein n=1 Tax=Mycena rosella TaxID=1033263 RepID=A0AAD7DMZ8_MYCRO|nr:hypothetical protein B0H17DRAFT_423809 [Mycena rosella]
MKAFLYSRLHGSVDHRYKPKRISPMDSAVSILTMGNTLTKSPQELASATERVMEKQRQLILEPASPPPPPGYVRAHFYSHLYRIHDRAPPDISADIPLCRSGGLDLDYLKHQWGLETCLPVDPLRWKPFQPTHIDYLSAVAVEVLSEGQGCIKFFEPTVSLQTLMQRQTRELVFGVASLIRLVCLQVIEMVSQCIEADTPLPALYRSVRRRAPRIALLEWEDMLNLLILFMWAALAFAAFGGYIELAPRERTRNWVRTGSFSL